LISKLIVVESESRWTAKQALEHPWIVTVAGSASEKPLHTSMYDELQNLSALSKQKIAQAKDAKTKQ